MRENQQVTTERLLAKAFGPNVRIMGATDLGGNWAPVQRLSLNNGSTVVVKTRRDLEALESALFDPRFRVFVHGDLGPNNVVLASGGARLVDFEGSGFRHFALDAASLRLPLIASSGQEPELALRRRTQIVQTLTSFAQIALQARCFESLAHWFLALADEMRERWDEARQPPRVFRAFTNGTDGVPS